MPAAFFRFKMRSLLHFVVISPALARRNIQQSVGKLVAGDSLCLAVELEGCLQALCNTSEAEYLGKLTANLEAGVALLLALNAECEVLEVVRHALLIIRKLACLLFVLILDNGEGAAVGRALECNAVRAIDDLARCHGFDLVATAA